MIKRREFIGGLGSAAVWPVVARAQQATACGTSACSCRATKTIPCGRLSFLRSLKHLRTWVGPLAARCGWTFVGPALTSIGYERSRRSWSACNPTCLCQRRRFALLRKRSETPFGAPSPMWIAFCRRGAGRSPGAVPDQVRDGPKPQDRQGARPRRIPIDSPSGVGGAARSPGEAASSR